MRFPGGISSVPTTRASDPVLTQHFLANDVSNDDQGARKLWNGAITFIAKSQSLAPVTFTSGRSDHLPLASLLGKLG
jgi:hypothetical protein